MRQTNLQIRQWCRAMKSTRLSLVLRDVAHSDIHYQLDYGSVRMTEAEADFGLKGSQRVIDVVRVVVACQFDTWWVQGSLPEKLSAVEGLVHPTTVAGPAAVIQAAIDFEVEMAHPPAE